MPRVYFPLQTKIEGNMVCGRAIQYMGAHTCSEDPLLRSSMSRPKPDFLESNPMSNPMACCRRIHEEYRTTQTSGIPTICGTSSLEEPQQANTRNSLGKKYYTLSVARVCLRNATCSQSPNNAASSRQQLFLRSAELFILVAHTTAPPYRTRTYSY